MAHPEAMHPSGRTCTSIRHCEAHQTPLYPSSSQIGPRALFRSSRGRGGRWASGRRTTRRTTSPPEKHARGVKATRAEKASRRHGPSSRDSHASRQKREHSRPSPAGLEGTSQEQRHPHAQHQPRRVFVSRCLMASRCMKSKSFKRCATVGLRPRSRTSWQQGACQRRHRDA